MRNLLLLGVVALAAGCTQQPQTPTTVSWSYGAGNGDGVTYPGPKPVYKRASGLGNDSASTTSAPGEQYSWGADGASGNMIQFAPPPTQTASPANPQAQQGAPGTHS